MPKYGIDSTKNLATAHKDLQLVFNTVILIYDNSVICGERGEAEQTKAFNDGFSKVQFPNSYHNKKPSMAVDATPYFKDKPHIHWDDIEEFTRFANLVLSIAEILLAQGKITHKVEWGGHWKNFKDYPHFQLRKVN
jgi:peptidoglycan L-alanyl-D-glutamate endopeptidase CwlK